MLRLRRLLRLTRLDDERGQAIPIFAGGLLAFLIMLGIIVDGGNGFQNKQLVQNAADASSIAAAYEVAQGNCTTATLGPCAGYAGMYAGFNGANGSDGNQTSLGALPLCNSGTGLNVTDTQPPTKAPGCYLYPYNGHDDQVEVWLLRRTSNFFGNLLGLPTSSESARAVASVTAGPPPQFQFVALDTSCENHTLLIKASGQLRVNQNIYDNADAGVGCNITDDAFDLFGTGGTITAPDIFTARGWEDHTNNPVGTTIFLHGQLPPGGNACPYLNSDKPGASTDSRCPHVNQPLHPDTFLPLAAPALGLPAWGSGAGVPVNITQISRGTNSAANVADVMTSSNHNLSPGDKVTISGVGFGFDGAYTVLATPNAKEFTYSNTGPNLPVVTQEQMTGGVATLTTNAPDTLSTVAPNNTVTVTGLQSFFNVANAIVTGVSSSSFSYNSPVASRRFNVTNKALQSGTATLKLSSTTGLVVGDTVSVSGLDAILNGSFVLTGVAGGNITYADNAASSLTVSQKAIANGTAATLTTSTNHVSPGDQITVNTGDSRFDGTFTATAGGGGPGGTTLSYTIPAVTATVSKTSAAAGTVTLTTSAAPPFENGDTVTTATGLLAYDGNPAGSFVIGNVNAGTKTFTYTSITFPTSSWSRSGTTVTITTASAHGLHAGDTVNITTFGGMQACLNKNGASVLSAPSPTTFTYTVAGTCVPPAGGNGKVRLVSAATANASGTVTLKTLPAKASGGTVAVPGFIASTAVTCTSCATLTDVPATAASGTFAPAWMPTSGIISKNSPGTPGNPAQFTVPAGSPPTTLQPGTYYGGICIGLAAGTTCNDANCAAVLTSQSYSGTAPTLSANITATQLTFNVTQQKIAAGDVIQIGTEDMLVTAATNLGAGQTLTVTRGYLSSTAAAGAAAAHNSGTTIKKVVSSVASTTAILTSGNYVMASGGFYVCGSANLSAPHVLIYNTDDTVSGTEVAKIAQFELFTLGNVQLAPQTTGLYAGLTIFQDHTNEVDTTNKCDQKSNQSSSWDIALVSMASTGANGPLGSISGSIYAADETSATPRDDFGDAVSGTATLAIMTDCIYIDGANSTFNFDSTPGKLFGLTATLSG